MVSLKINCKSRFTFKRKRILFLFACYRGQNTGDPTPQSYENVGLGRNVGTPTQEEQAKGIKIQVLWLFIIRICKSRALAPLGSAGVKWIGCGTNFLRKVAIFS